MYFSNHSICVYTPPNRTNCTERLNKRHITFNIIPYLIHKLYKHKLYLERKKNRKSKFTNKTMPFPYQQTI